MQKNERLDLITVTAAVEHAVRTNTILRDRMAEGGRCFHLAFFAAMDLSDRLGCECLVVHAILGNGLCHAWTEVDGLFCVDLTLAAEHPELVTLTKDGYLTKASPSISRAYGALEALFLTEQNHGIPGPWHSPFTEQLEENHRAASKLGNAGKPERESDE